MLGAVVPQMMSARADEAFARSLAPGLRDNAYVLTHNPGMFQLWGVSAGQMSLAVTNPAYIDELAARFSGGVYLHWNFWCSVQDQVQRDVCSKALALRPAERVREYQEREQRYILYRLDRSLPKH